ncbi:MAG: hypothetical protein BAJALOKI1v1_190016 [Promethearchaeota archaeon]|nr:MAG: hypothetical protein BAJALOKI1v1_190016 [Candidatus Lokiarchaeota archaeon]
MSCSSEKITIKPVGHVKVKGEDPMNAEYFIEILEPYRKALKELDKFSHVIVFWWADQNDDEELRSSEQVLTCVPPYAEGAPETGIFATRSEFRPNPIAITIAQILGIDQKKGLVKVNGMDAFNGTPVVDLKAYFPISDRIRDCHIAPWLKDWPEWQEDGLQWWLEQGFFEE